MSKPVRNVEQGLPITKIGTLFRRMEATGKMERYL